MDEGQMAKAPVQVPLAEGPLAEGSAAKGPEAKGPVVEGPKSVVGAVAGGRLINWELSPVL